MNSLSGAVTAFQFAILKGEALPPPPTPDLKNNNKQQKQQPTCFKLSLAGLEEPSLHSLALLLNSHHGPIK